MKLKGLPICKGAPVKELCISTNETGGRTGFLRRKILPVVVAIFMVQAFISVEAVISKDATFSISRRDKLFATFFLDDRKGFMVGTQGLLLRTTDGGEDWQRITLDRIADSLNDITFFGKDGWIVGGKGLVLHTADGGQQWIKQNSNSDNSLLALHFINQKKGFAVGEGGTILTTEDGGVSWGLFPLDWLTILPKELEAMGVVAPNLYDVFFVDEFHGWIVGEKGIMLSTSDGGKQWSLLGSGTDTSLYSVYFKDQSEGLAVGAEGAFLQTQDGGITWKQIDLPAEVDKISLFKLVMRGSEGIIVGDRGIVLRSKDGGKTWDKVDLSMHPPLPWFLCAHLFSQNSPTQVLIAGKGIITKTKLQ